MSMAKGNFIAGQWMAGESAPFRSASPATGQTVWEGHAASESAVDLAIHAASDALPEWAELAFDDRSRLLKKYAEVLDQRKSELAEIICRETGKPRWEALIEVGSMVQKIEISISAYESRQSPSAKVQAGVRQWTQYKPMGVMAVFGPFNMPGHLPNGHIVPALLAGNTVVFKPSELTPGVGELIAEIFAEAALPPGVFNLLQGGRDVAQPWPGIAA